MNKTIGLKWIIAGLLTWLAVQLAGCLAPFSRAPQYTEEELAALLERGKEIVLETLGEDCEVLSAIPYYPYHTSQILSEYVEGEYRQEENVWTFLVNTNTKEVYTSRYQEELKEQTKDRILESLELAGKGTLLSVETEGITVKQEKNDIQYCGLPVEITDISAYIESEERQPIVMTLLLSVPEEEALSEYTFDYIKERTKNLSGIRFEVTLSDGGEEAVLRENGRTYKHWQFVQKGDFLIGGCNLMITEEEGQTGVLCTRREQDLTKVRVEKEEDGYQFYVQDAVEQVSEGEKPLGFFLYAMEQDEVLSGTFIRPSDGGGTEWTSYWEKDEKQEGRYILCDSLNNPAKIFRDIKLRYAQNAPQ